MKHLKLSLAFLLAAALVMRFGTAAFAEEGSAAAEGLDETVTVTVTVDDGKITGVEAVTDKEEETVGRQALTEIPAAMLEANSVNVDGISGATATSNAVLSAAAEAYLESLGVNVDLSVWADGQGYVTGEDYRMVPAVDAVTSATESGQGGINFGDVDLSDELKKELILD